MVFPLKIWGRNHDTNSKHQCVKHVSDSDIGILRVMMGLQAINCGDKTACSQLISLPGTVGAGWADGDGDV